MIWTFLLSTVGRYVIGGAIITALAGGGYFYVSHLRHKVQVLEIQNQQLERAKTIYEQDRKTDDEVQNEKDRIDQLEAGNLQSEFDRLRQYGSGKSGKSN